VALIALLGAALYWLRPFLASHGFALSDEIYLVALLAVLGGTYGGLASWVLRVAGGRKKAQLHAEK